jgi:hypothetical protein
MLDMIVRLDISVGIATGWAVGVRFPAGRRGFCLYSVQTGPEANAGSYPMGTRDFLGD